MQGDAASASERHVVLIHGIWMPAIVMWPMAMRLRRSGFTCHLFGYPTLSKNLAENAIVLDEFMQSITASQLHIVAHSLGGLLVRALFRDFPQQKPGRIVMLGTPSAGSEIGERLQTLGAPGKWILGRSLGQYLQEGRNWPLLQRELGVIAGSLSFGMGTLMGGLSGPGDGTVLVDETRCADMTDHLVLPLTHTALVTAASAAAAAAAFLEHGTFP